MENGKKGRLHVGSCYPPSPLDGSQFPFLFFSFRFHREANSDHVTPSTHDVNQAPSLYLFAPNF